MKIYKKCITEPYSFLVNDTTLPSDDPLRFRKNLLEILIERLQKYQLHHQAKLINMNILLVKSIVTKSTANNLTS